MIRVLYENMKEVLAEAKLGGAKEEGAYVHDFMCKSYP